jgi:predicted lipoprotein with Yx(FWY)xxD motif
MIRRSLQVLAFAALLSPAVAWAQPVDLPIPPATTTEYPAGVSVAKVGGGMVYVDAQGHTLYGMDMRAGLLRFSPDPAQYCKDACAQEWVPLLAPPGSKANIKFPMGFGRPPAPPAGAAGAAPGRPAAPLTADQAAYGRVPTAANLAGDGLFTPNNAPDWTIIEGPNGPQWVYKVWHMVYVRKGEKPRSATAEGAENMTWNTLKFVPPVPQMAAPTGIGATFVDGAYVLADKDGRVLFTGKCSKDCTGWVPLSGGMASNGFGEWQVSHEADQPQWLYRGKPVFISQEGGSKIPGKGMALRP